MNFITVDRRLLTVDSQSFQIYRPCNYDFNKSMIEKLSISDFDYDLPEERIAPFPANQRDMSKLLVYNGKKLISHDSFRHIVNYLSEDSFLVFNNTRVIHARLLFENATGSITEIFCLKPIEPVEYETAFRKTDECTWECMIGNLRKWKNDVIIRSIPQEKGCFELVAKKVLKTNNGYHIQFSWSDPALTFGEVIEKAGIIPLPPYIKRQPVAADYFRYQTVYAQHKGSVAAPTAGLHFSEQIMMQLHEKNIKHTMLTLHIGAGTFLPVKSEVVTDHVMHAEQFSVSRKTLEILLNHTGSLTAVGTTTVRALESLYWLGIRLKNDMKTGFHVDQWVPYNTKGNLDKRESLEILCNYLNSNHLDELAISTSIMIMPGYKFHLVDQLVTNFHQPKSTLLLLVAAFIGEDWKRVYEYALEHDFRFLSYGDSSLLIPGTHE